MMNIDIINKQLNKLALKAYYNNEIPVGALLIKNGKIESKAYNSRNKSGNPLEHAEILCIIKAAKKQKYWRLNDYILYTTLEPCEMCKSIIENCGIKEVHYFASTKSKHNQVITKYIHEEKYSNSNEKLIKNFFKKLRKE